MIELKQAGFSYPGEETRVLDNIDLTIGDGEFVVVLGGSGCGKSTLLSLIAGLRTATTGEVVVDGKSCFEPGGSTGILFQHNSLFPWMTVKKNVSFGIRQAFPGMKKAEREQRAAGYLESVGLEDCGGKYPGQLSGGMQQRAAIARMMAMDQDLLLLDEPFASLDPKNRMELQQLLEIMWKKGEKKKTIVFVTHDVDEAIFLGDRVIFLDGRKVRADFDIPFKRPRGIDTILKEEEYCVIRKRLIDLYYDGTGHEDYGEKDNCRCGCGGTEGER